MNLVDKKADGTLLIDHDSRDVDIPWFRFDDHLKELFSKGKIWYSFYTRSGIKSMRIGYIKKRVIHFSGRR